MLGKSSFLDEKNYREIIDLIIDRLSFYKLSYDIVNHYEINIYR